MIFKGWVFHHLDIIYLFIPLSWETLIFPLLQWLLTLFWASLHLDVSLQLCFFFSSRITRTGIFKILDLCFELLIKTLSSLYSCSGMWECVCHHTLPACIRVFKNPCQLEEGKIVLFWNFFQVFIGHFLLYSPVPPCSPLMTGDMGNHRPLTWTSRLVHS